MAFEKITLDVNANGEMQTFHSKQYDVGRPIIIDLVVGEDAYTPAAGVTFELHCRKVDFNLVVLTDYEIDQNQITFTTTEQLTACVGDNLATLKIILDDLVIATMNFILNVAIDPDAHGIISESEIDNLTTQIEEITEQVIGDNYYDKTETDALLDLKADAADVYTKTQVDTALALKADKSDTYTKAQVDSALSAKANTADLATVATTGDYDDLINKPTIPAAQVQSDYAQSDNTKVDYIKNKPDILGMINQAIDNIMPVGTAGPSLVANFETELAKPLQSVTVDVVATGGNGTPSTPIPINGYTEANITRCGVNLLNMADCIDDYFIQSGTKTVTRIEGASVFYCDVPKNTNLTITPNNSNRCVIMGYQVRPQTIENSIGDELLVDSASGITSQTINTGNNTFIAMYLNRTSEYKPTQLQVEVGLTASTFSPYNGNTYTIAFGQTVYGGVLDVTRGKLTVTHALLEKTVASMNNGEDYPGWSSSGIKALVGEGLNGTETDQKLNIGTEFSVNTTGIYDILYLRKQTYGLTQSQWIANYPDLNVQIAVQLATPFDIDLTPVQISAIVGENNVYSDTNGNTTVQYKDSIQHYIDTRV